jgi:hypothetical protein
MANRNFDFPPASDSNSQVGSLTDRFQGLRQALIPDSGESSNEQQRPHRRPQPQTNASRFRPGRRTSQSGHYAELPVLRGSPSPSSSPSSYTPPRSRPGRGRHPRNSWRRFRREMQDETANLEGLNRSGQVHLRQLHSELNGVYYLFGVVYYG